MDALGPVEIQPLEQEDAILLHEMIAGLGVSWQAKISLRPEEARVRMELSVFNRNLVPVECHWGLSANLPGSASTAGTAIYDEERKAGLGIQPEPNTLAARSTQGTYLELTVPNQPLMPRQLAHFNVLITPISGLPALTSANASVAAHLNDSHLTLQSHQGFPSAKIFILTASGQTLESPLDLTVGSAQEMPLPEGERFIGLVIEDSKKREIARWEKDGPSEITTKPLPSIANEAVQKAKNQEAEPTTGESAYAKAVDYLNDPAIAAPLFIQATASTPLKSAAFVGLAMTSLAQKQYKAAAEFLETALLFNAEDHLAWWLKAVAERLAGSDENERPDLLNAHFLSPMEPVLRVESFLSQNQHGKDPSASISPLGENPEALIEAACLLLEAGLQTEAARWIDEALRHRDVPMLRYLHAWSLLQGSRMAAEAAEQVSAAGKLPLEPPFPWRSIEIKAIKDLLTRFPEDERLKTLEKLIASAYPSTC